MYISYFGLRRVAEFVLCLIKALVSQVCFIVFVAPEALVVSHS